MFFVHGSRFFFGTRNRLEQAPLSWLCIDRYSIATRDMVDKIEPVGEVLGFFWHV